MPGVSTGDAVDDIERMLRAGLAEAAGKYREEFEPFVVTFAPKLAEIALRAEMGSEAAKVSLRMLRQQALTHQFIANVKAVGVTQSQIATVIGWVGRVLLGVL